jgi:hypothetical protein
VKPVSGGDWTEARDLVIYLIFPLEAAKNLFGTIYMCDKFCTVGHEGRRPPASLPRVGPTTSPRRKVGQYDLEERQVPLCRTR